MDKKTIREKILTERDTLNATKIHAFSANITKFLLASNEYKTAKNIFIFINFGSEVITKDIILDAFKENKTVAIPFTYNKPRKMIASKISSLDELVEGKYGILSVDENKIIEVPKEEIDLVIVPSVAFDREGYRVGYGGGYYDRFLEDIPKVKKIGIAFDLQIVNEVPRESFDISVDKVITEKEIIYVK
ncbi:MAG: 5-formyltetrahydrofolate cyclo-ligase [Tissierellia bacterium]|nr:5-formyltetrahydrofolate cyclo-ligase [Tissierellia bacterium]